MFVEQRGLVKKADMARSVRAAVRQDCYRLNAWGLVGKSIEALKFGDRADFMIVEADRHGVVALATCKYVEAVGAAPAIRIEPGISIVFSKDRLTGHDSFEDSLVIEAMSRVDEVRARAKVDTGIAVDVIGEAGLAERIRSEVWTLASFTFGAPITLNGEKVEQIAQPAASTPLAVSTNPTPSSWKPSECRLIDPIAAKLLDWDDYRAGDDDAAALRVRAAAESFSLCDVVSWAEVMRDGQARWEGKPPVDPRETRLEQIPVFGHDLSVEGYLDDAYDDQDLIGYVGVGSRDELLGYYEALGVAPHTVRLMQGTMIERNEPHSGVVYGKIFDKGRRLVGAFMAARSICVDVEGDGFRAGYLVTARVIAGSPEHGDLVSHLASVAFSAMIVMDLPVIHDPLAILPSPVEDEVQDAAEDRADSDGSDEPVIRMDARFLLIPDRRIDAIPILVAAEASFKDEEGELGAISPEGGSYYDSMEAHRVTS